MDLSERIITYITNHHPISYLTVLQVAQGKGFTEREVAMALEKVHKNKTITTKVRKDVIWYDLAPIPKPYEEPAHLKWSRDNYPYPTNFIMPWPDWDLSYLFMKPDEAEEYRQQMKGGVPKHLLKKHYAK